VSFSSPFLLLFLLVVPAAAAGWWWLERRREQRASAWAAPALLPNMVSRPPAWRRRLPTALLLLGLALLLVGFARPQATFSVSRQEATMIVVLDVSGSMLATDSNPSRLGAAKKAALDYVDQLPSGYRMSLVTFSDHTAVTVPPTHDLTLMRNGIKKAKAGPQGTALADAALRAVQVGSSVEGTQKSKRPPAAIVLFSDGGQTAGRVTPKQAAAKAKQAGIPITAVALGTPDGVVLQKLKGGFTERIQVPADPASLQLLATSSGGHYVHGVAGVSPKATYAELGSRVGNKDKKIEVTAAAAGGGLAFMLAAATLSGLWFRRFP
jgi:Ca-activated chloride channel family protein